MISLLLFIGILILIIVLIFVGALVYVLVTDREEDDDGYEDEGWK